MAEFIEDHLDAPLVLDDLARQVWLSPYLFARAFKRTSSPRPAPPTCGYHRVGDATWMVTGRYVMRLERADGSDWRIAAMTLRHYYDDGDRGLVDVAIKRAVDGAGRAAGSG